jgi:hypothetical protein
LEANPHKLFAQQYLKTSQQKTLGLVAQGLECLPRKHQALTLSPSPIGKNNQVPSQGSDYTERQKLDVCTSLNEKLDRTQER